MHQFHFSGSPRPIFSWRPFGGLAILFAAASVINAVQPAEARRLTYYDSFYQGWFQIPRQAYRSRRHERAPDRRPVERRPVERGSAEQKAVEGKKPSGPLYAVVSLADQHVSFYDANGLWGRSVVSTGVAGHPTPPGIFTILEKERWHRSNIYSGAPMPYMQRLAWTGVAMHEGVVTGRPASHGCIRLPGAFAKRLFGLTNVGQRVVISPQDVTPSDIVNAHLPVPQLQTPPAGAEDKTAVIKGGKAVEIVALDKPAAGEDSKLLNPAQFAQALKIASAANVASAAQAKKAALAIAAAKSEDARQAARELSVAEESVRRARAEIEDATRSMARAQGDEAVKKATDRKSAAEAKLAEAEGKVREASETKAAKDKDAVSAQNAVREAAGQASAASASAKDATIRTEPISIFISRKNKRLYVRQATQHLFDMPITIRDPERPLGTHLFIATHAGDDGASLRWVGLTPPAAVEVKHRRHSSRRGRTIEPEDETPSLKPFPETAPAALDRIELPPEAVQRIAERTWVGATLIISDVGMSGEGRYPMDFMILSHTIVRED
jgi:lipoprotein-anchoring transpeptidase ErfK/SrfK